jgi:hypothetical protein
MARDKEVRGKMDEGGGVEKTIDNWLCKVVFYMELNLLATVTLAHNPIY